MMNNAWKLNESDKSYGKGWSDSKGTSSPAKSYSSRGGAPQKAEEKKPTGSAIEILRERLCARGAKGFIGMQRQFKIMDDNRSGSIDK